jgi:Flp pilus assembly protein TadD
MVTTIPRRTAVLAAGLALALAAGCGAAKQHNKIQKAGEELRFELAALYVDKGVDQAAVPLLQKVLAEDPKDVRARLLYGKVLRDLGLHPQAERELLFALQLDPNNPETHAALGILYDVKRETDKARSHHVAAVKLAPGMARYRNNLGFSLYLAGNYQAAAYHLEQALAMDPSLVVAYNNLGFTYGRLHKFERARKTFRSALSEASTLINMALVYEDHGDADRAASLRNAAYAINPDLRPDEDKL